MTNSQIILSYHIFGDEPNEYKFSRTFDQFAHDIDKKVYDQIHIDDARLCTIKACDMLRNSNRRAKIFVCTELVGKEGFCTWDDIKRLSRFHDIENHSHYHKDHSKVLPAIQYRSIKMAQDFITKEIGRKPRFFVAPYNSYNEQTEAAAKELGLICVKERVNMTNISK